MTNAKHLGPPSDSLRPTTKRASAWVKSASVFLFAFLIHFAGTSLLPLMDRDEPRFAEAAREMKERGNWVVPCFNNQHRFDKPPLTYWLEVACFEVFGETDWAARLPSVVAAALTAVAIYGFGRRIWDDATGFLAALMYSTCLQVMIHSKLCVADPLMILFVTLGVWSGWEIISARREGRPASKIWLWSGILIGSLALGFLAKGPIAWLPLGMLLWMRWRRASGCLSGTQLTGIFLSALLLIAAWATPALLETDGEYFRVGIGRHVIARGLSPLENHGARNLFSYLALLPFYLVTVFASFFPWSCWLPGILRHLKCSVARNDPESYLLSGVIIIFGIFTFYNTRLPHYTLPAFPMLALLTARRCKVGGGDLRLVRKCIIAMAAFDLILSCAFFPFARKWFVSPQLAQTGAGLVQPGMEFASTEFDEPSLVWYFRKQVHGFGVSLHANSLPAWMAGPGARFCIIPANDVGKLFPQIPTNWTNTPIVNGFNFANGRSVSLRMLIKPE